MLLWYYESGEVTPGHHVAKARDVHLVTNKDKLMIVLYSSKTHDLSCRPQKIKISSNKCDRAGTGKYTQTFLPLFVDKNIYEA